MTARGGQPRSGPRRVAQRLGHRLAPPGGQKWLPGTSAVLLWSSYAGRQVFVVSLQKIQDTIRSKAVLSTLVL